MSIGLDWVAQCNSGNFYCNPQIVMMESPRCGSTDYISQSLCLPFISGIYSFGAEPQIAPASIRLCHCSYRHGLSITDGKINSVTVSFHPFIHSFIDLTA